MRKHVRRGAKPAEAAWRGSRARLPAGRIVEREEGRSVSQHDQSWKFADDIVTESPVVQAARAQSLELGIEPVSPAVGAQAAVIAAASQATSILEVGTGVGVSGLWLLRGAGSATLTSIDVEADHLHNARTNFTDAGIQPARVRLITGRARDVLPRMNENAYDIVFVDAKDGTPATFMARNAASSPGA